MMAHFQSLKIGSLIHIIYSDDKQDKGLLENSFFDLENDCITFEIYILLKNRILHCYLWNIIRLYDRYFVRASDLFDMEQQIDISYTNNKLQSPKIVLPKLPCIKYQIFIDRSISHLTNNDVINIPPCLLNIIKLDTNIFSKYRTNRYTIAYPVLQQNSINVILQNFYNSVLQSTFVDSKKIAKDLAQLSLMFDFFVWRCLLNESELLKAKYLQTKYRIDYVKCGELVTLIDNSYLFDNDINCDKYYENKISVKSLLYMQNHKTRVVVNNFISSKIQWNTIIKIVKNKPIPTQFVNRLFEDFVTFNNNANIKYDSNSLTHYMPMEYFLRLIDFLNIKDSQLNQFYPVQCLFSTINLLLKFLSNNMHVFKIYYLNHQRIKKTAVETIDIKQYMYQTTDIYVKLWCPMINAPNNHTKQHINECYIHPQLNYVTRIANCMDK